MPRLRYRAKTPPSRLEAKFALYWRGLGGPPLEREFRFHPERKWRADFAHIESRTLIEIEGGIYIEGGGPTIAARDSSPTPRSISKPFSPAGAW